MRSHAYRAVARNVNGPRTVCQAVEDSKNLRSDSVGLVNNGNTVILQRLKKLRQLKSGVPVLQGTGTQKIQLVKLRRTLHPAHGTVQNPAGSFDKGILTASLLANQADHLPCQHVAGQVRQVVPRSLGIAGLGGRNPSTGESKRGHLGENRLNSLLLKAGRQHGLHFGLNNLTLPGTPGDSGINEGVVVRKILNFRKNLNRVVPAIQRNHGCGISLAVLNQLGQDVIWSLNCPGRSSRNGIFRKNNRVGSANPENLNTNRNRFPIIFQSLKLPDKFCLLGIRYGSPAYQVLEGIRLFGLVGSPLGNNI